MRIAAQVLKVVREASFTSRHPLSPVREYHGEYPASASRAGWPLNLAFTMDTYGYLDRGLQAPVAAKLQTWLLENAPK